MQQLIGVIIIATWTDGFQFNRLDRYENFDRNSFYHHKLSNVQTHQLIYADQRSTYYYFIESN